MTQAQLIPFLLVLAAIAVVVIIAVGRSVLRELQGGLGDDDEAQAARRNTEERKNERIARELEKMRGEKTPAEDLNDRKLIKQIEQWRDGA